MIENLSINQHQSMTDFKTPTVHVLMISTVKAGDLISVPLEKSASLTFLTLPGSVTVTREDHDRLMALYIYRELQAKVGELRLVALQPGSYHDVLRCKIVHCPLLEPKAAVKDERLPVSELQKTLSDGWTVKQTLDGRYLFMPTQLGNP